MRLYTMCAGSPVKMSPPCQILLCMLCSLQRAGCMDVHIRANPICPTMTLSNKTAQPCQIYLIA